MWTDVSRHVTSPNYIRNDCASPGYELSAQPACELKEVVAVGSSGPR